MSAALSPSLIDLQRRFAATLTSLGLTPKSVARGISFKSGHLTLCRIDPKPTKRIVRVEVGAEAEEMHLMRLLGRPIARRVGLRSVPSMRT